SELDADLTTARVDRARAQGLLAGFFAPSTDPAALVVAVAPAPRATLPPVEEFVASAERTLPELAALKHEVEASEFAIRAAGRRPIPEPEIVAGTKSSNVGGGDVGGVFSLHAEVAALRAIVVERRQAADSYRASTATSANQLERIAQVSYDAGERGIL